ncbi:MAG: hypothetical protein OEW97_02130 [Gammaproteobacteria bacterium]|nr:hypothetical protein [Gammaproteobacteria bacterium]
MELLNKTETEIIDTITPIAKNMIDAWSKDDYDSFINYFHENSLSHEDFKTQRSWVHYLGAYSLDKLVEIHKNPDNLVIIWKIKFANREELGIGIYRFIEENKQIKSKGCIYIK